MTATLSQHVVSQQHVRQDFSAAALSHLAVSHEMQKLALTAQPHEMNLIAQLQTIVMKTRSPGTLGTYTSPWNRFAQWCYDTGRIPFPASPQNVALFFVLVANTSKTYAPVKAASAAIFSAHDLAIHESRTNSLICKITRQGLKRHFGMALTNKKDPVSTDIVIKFAGMFAPIFAAIVDLMFASNISLCFAGFLRYSDAMGVFVDEIMWFEHHFELFIETRKNDQLRFGSVIVIAYGTTPACPGKLVSRLIAEANLRGLHVPLFQGFNGRLKLSSQVLNSKAIDYQQCRYNMLKRLTKVTDMSLAEVTKRYGTQSMRSGGHHRRQQRHR